MNNLFKYLPFIFVAMYLLYIFGMAFLISYVTKKVFFSLYEKNNKIVVDLLPYTCRLSNFSILKTFVNFVLIAVLVIGVPFIAIFLVLQRVAPDVIMDFSLQDLLNYILIFCGLMLLGMFFCFFLKSKSTIEITDNYIEFNWQCTDKDCFSGKLFYNTIRKLSVGRCRFLVETDKQEITILYEKLICYKGYNKVIEILKGENKCLR